MKTLLAAVPAILKVTDLPAEQQTIIEDFVESFSKNLKTLEFGAKLTK